MIACSAGRAAAGAGRRGAGAAEAGRERGGHGAVGAVLRALAAAARRARRWARAVPRAQLQRQERGDTALATLAPAAEYFYITSPGPYDVDSAFVQLVH